MNLRNMITEKDNENNKELSNLHKLETLCNKECWFFNEDGYGHNYKRVARVRGNKKEASEKNMIKNRTHNINLSKTGLLSWESSNSNNDKDYTYQFSSFKEALVWWNKYIPNDNIISKF